MTMNDNNTTIQILNKYVDSELVERGIHEDSRRKNAGRNLMAEKKHRDVLSITPEEVVAAYKETGVKIYRGGYSPYDRESRQYIKTACCGLGVIALKELGEADYDLETSYSLFVEDDNDDDLVEAFGNGFDGDPYPDYDSSYYKANALGWNCYQAAVEAGIPIYKKEEEKEVE